MDSASIRKQLHNYLDVANDRKLRAIYVMVENDIFESNEEYSDKLKRELDRRVESYLKGGKHVSADEMNKRIQKIRKKQK
jgi:hypothetical protein